ncbi:MAG: hypothetical protein BCV62_14090 [Pseudomonas sp. K35]|nr:MAG: hypothetical protein BCV62_14090 [Pseudomonas sp. K35]
MQVAIEHAADDLPASADEGLAMADLLAAWVTTEKAERRIGVAKPDDWLQRITLEYLVDRSINAIGVRGKLAQRLTYLGG